MYQIEDFQENYSSGWVKFYRSITKHWLWPKQRALTKLEAWMLILLETNHEPERFNIGFSVYECQRGEKLYSLDTWAKMFNWNKSKVRRFFAMLQKDKMIELKSEQKTTRLTVCNYDIYQSVRHVNDTQATRKRHQYKNEKNEKNNNINIIGDSFAIFWDKYDKKVGDKSKCEKKWNSLKQSERDKVLSVLPDWLKHIKDKQFQPYPYTFLNQRRWEDEVETKKLNLL
jgi:hypothetical protein